MRPLLFAALLGVVPLSSIRGQTATAAIVGQVVDGETRTPVGGAALVILGTPRTATTDSAGRFELGGLTRGSKVLRARAIGYIMASWLVELADGQVVDHVFEMQPRPIALPEVVVEASPSTDWRSIDAFEQRRARGVGHFITREEIDNRNAVILADLLRTVPGVRTTCTYAGCVVQMVRSTLQCRPEYFMDGYPATYATGPDFPSRFIQSVEIYNNASDTPVELQRPGLRCGVIVIWTRTRR